ncbi:MAG: helix-turn-helix domain-containing protein [Candidatus Omnitrophota bacterium]|nr:helix-turn-helix domain-containing protein [Candidatus Omnitrophota bacterium]
MAGKDIISMTQGELQRLHVVRKALDKTITQAEAADIIGRCSRQVRRIVSRVKREGDSGVIHKSRSQDSNRALSVRIKSKVLKLYKEKYPDFGPTLASEKLFEINKIKLNDETLRLWLLKANIPYKQRKKRPHRQWCQRKDRFGEMVQMDGSEHDWFEGRGPKCVFMGYIDDANNHKAREDKSAKTLLAKAGLYTSSGSPLEKIKINPQFPQYEQKEKELLLFEV